MTNRRFINDSLSYTPRMSGYWLTFGGAAALCGGLHYYTSPSEPKSTSESKSTATHCPISGNSSEGGTCPFAAFSAKKSASNFPAFQQNWLIAYCLAMFADWLQGPYVYALYASYGYSPSSIAFLFVSGFASSMIFGTVAGNLTDRLGRRNMCLVYAVFYSISALTKLSSAWPMLLLGRLFSGISTSLLYSAFEAWMISEHNSRGFASNLLSETFAKATACNGLSAVIAGLTASFLADSYGFRAPFAFSILPLIALSFVVSGWVENYGGRHASSAGTNLSTTQSEEGFAAGFNAIRSEPSLVLLGLAQALFEGSMYTFVFNWSPMLLGALGKDASHDAIPFGLVFASFMVAMMIGSYVFKIICARFSPAISPFFIHAMAAVCFGVASLSAKTDILNSIPVLMLCFLVFEACVGAFWPTYGTIRSQYVPESTRAAVSSLFRVPLNMFVLTLLLNSEALSTAGMFTLCSLAQVASLVLYGIFYTKKAAIELKES